MEIIGLVGYKRCGKSSAAKVLVHHHGFIEYGFADALRRMALAVNPVISVTDAYFRLAQRLPPMREYRYSDIINALGYEEAKEIPDVRRFLRRLGTEGVRDTFGPNAWVDALARKLLLDNPSRVVVSDVRFHSEADWIRKQGGQLWRVQRPGYGGDDPHSSEKDIAEIGVDVMISAHTLELGQQQVLQAYAESRQAE